MGSPMTVEGSKQTTRPIEGIDQSTALNKALWTLAEEMKALKSGQS
jgi:hypothetical protein